MTLVRADALERFAAAIVAAMGAPEEVAAAVAGHLVLANLSGHDSHGVMRLPLYVQMADRGALRPAHTPQVLAETETTVLVDARRGFGQHSTLFALERCMDRAVAAGVVAGTVRHSTHTGRLGTYPERAAARGLVSLVTTGSAGPGYGLVAPFGGAGRFLSTNPWAIGIPADGRPSFVYDAATTTIAEGKNQLARARGEEVPEGALLDASGLPTTDPEDLYRGGTMTAMGGAAAGHKGYGLSLAAALLGALGMIGDPDPTPAGALEGFAGVGGVFMIVIDPRRFGPAAEYRALVSRTLSEVKQVAPAPGRAEVLYAGEPEARSRAARLETGVPLPDAVWRELGEVAARYGLDLPRSVGSSC